MKTVAIGVLALLLAVGVAGTLWVVGNPAPKEHQSAAPAAAPAEETANAPPISEKGPWPKAVASEKEFRFGMMTVGERRSHKFVIENQGEAPLKLAKGPTSCKCTLSKVAEDDIPVGAKVEVELAWEPKAITENFRQTAKIFTNDPKNKTIDLIVQGEVGEAFSIIPPENWTVGEVLDDKPATLEGEIISRASDKFAVTELKGSSDNLTAEAVPMTPEQLERRKAKSGYVIKATLKAGDAVGPFRETLTIKTDVADHGEFPIRVVGRRPGPLQFQGTPDMKWDPDHMLIDLGEFDSAQGKKAKLLLIVSGEKSEDLEFTSIQSDTPFIKVSIEKDVAFKAPNRGRYQVIVDVPPGSPAVTMVRSSSAKVKVKTNHPRAAEIELRVGLVSF